MEKSFIHARFEILRAVVYCGLDLAAIWRCVVGLVVPDFSTDRGAFVFSTKQTRSARSRYCFPPNICVKEGRSF